jgi:hypothetical protein
VIDATIMTGARAPTAGKIRFNTSFLTVLKTVRDQAIWSGI